MSYAIRVENLSKRYSIRKKNSFLLVDLYHAAKSKLTGEKNSNGNAFWALSDLNFTVEKGKSLGVVGPNGAGKSTLLKLLAGVSAPTTGHIDVKGKISCLIEVGAGFHPELTGRENIYLNASILGLKRRNIDQKIAGIIEFAEISDFIDVPIKRYSSGMKVRLGFSVAIHVEPEILLVDEVLSVGDASFRAKCSEKIQELRRIGTTILLVSHNNLTINNNCDKAVYLQNGRMKQYGETRDVLAAYERDIEETEKKRLNRLLVGSNSRGKLENDRIEIAAFELLDSKGRVKTEFGTGEKMIIRIQYKAKTILVDPVFGIGILRNDGLHCFGTLSKFAGTTFGNVVGKGSVSLEIYRLNLLKGWYQITMGIFDESGKYQIYMNLDIARFFIETNREDHGAFFMEHQWQVLK